jgi:membrane-associated phospholipid phosphatase
MMRDFAKKLLQNFGASFGVQNVDFHLLAIALTYLIVSAGLDEKYYAYFNHTLISYLFFPAVILGGLLPIIIPVALLIAGRIKRRHGLVTAGLALGQAAILGSLISSLYKAVTGRLAPDQLPAGVHATFRFGFLRGGIFWGWPSSHTTIAFAMACALAALYGSKKTIAYPALLYAFYVGIGVSMSIHWFSDAVAGAIIGSVIGITVGRSYRESGA